MILLRNKSSWEARFPLDREDKKSYSQNMKSSDLRKIRRQLDLTQREFAELLGVVGRTVRRWENEETEIPRRVEGTIREIERGGAR